MAANVFVHGYMGWGSFDIPYKAVPYWGMFTGDLLKRLRKQGFECVSASVAPLELHFAAARKLVHGADLSFGIGQRHLARKRQALLHRKTPLPHVVAERAPVVEREKVWRTAPCTRVDNDLRA